jgi:hypothetical protein
MQDMEVVINKEIMKLKFEEKDFTQLGRNQYRRWDFFYLFRSLDIGRNYLLYIWGETVLTT